MNFFRKYQLVVLVFLGLFCCFGLALHAETKEEKKKRKHEEKRKRIAERAAKKGKKVNPDYPKVDVKLIPLILKMESGKLTEPVLVPWRLYVPPEATADNKLPLVFFLHGMGRKGKDNVGPMDLAVTFWSEEAQKKHPCYVLTPQCTKKPWAPIPRIPGKRGRDNYKVTEKPANTTAGALMILDKIIKEKHVDPKRVYVTGQSMGGYGTWEVLYRRPKLFAAAIPICGGGDPSQVSKYKDVPIWVFHGENDTTVPAENSRILIKALKDAGGNPKYTEFKNVGHGSWQPAYAMPELHEWLFSQKKE